MRACVRSGDLIFSSQIFGIVKCAVRCDREYLFGAITIIRSRLLGASRVLGCPNLFDVRFAHDLEAY